MVNQNFSAGRRCARHAFSAWGLGLSKAAGNLYGLCASSRPKQKRPYSPENCKKRKVSHSTSPCEAPAPVSFPQATGGRCWVFLFSGFCLESLALGLMGVFTAFAAQRPLRRSSRPFLGAPLLPRLHLLGLLKGCRTSILHMWNF